MQHRFVVGEINEEADIFLTVVSLILSVVALVAGSWFCFYGLLKPCCKMLQKKLIKDE